MTDLGGADRGSQRGGVPVQGQMGSPLEQRAADFRGADRGSQRGGGSLCRAEGANWGTERGVFTGKGRGLFRLDFETFRCELRVPNPRVEVSGLKPRDDIP